MSGALSQQSNAVVYAWFEHVVERHPVRWRACRRQFCRIARDLAAQQREEEHP